MRYRMRIALMTGLLSMLILGTAHGQKNKDELMRLMKEADKTAPRLADQAPLFKLKSMDGKSESDLAVLDKTKPVVLIFGSYT